MTKACKMLIFLFLALSLGACNAGPSDLDPSSSSGNDGIRGNGEFSDASGVGPARGSANTLR